MKDILKSATRIVLLMIASTLCVMVLFSCSVAVWRGTMDASQILAVFKDATLMVLAFYFAYKGSGGESGPTPAYAGK